MALRVQTQISGDVFIFLCDGRIVYGDEGAALRERVGNTLPGTPRIVLNLKGWITSTAVDWASWLDSWSRRETAVANLSWSLRASASRMCFGAQIWTQYSGCTRTTTRRSQPSANR